MRRTLAIMLVVTLILGIISTGPTFTNAGSINNVRNVTFHGTVIQKNSKTMTITMNMWEYLQIEITIDKATKYYDGTGDSETEIKSSKIKKGDKVTVLGEIVTKTNSPTKFVAEKVTKINKFPADKNKKNDNVKEANYIGIVVSRNNQKIVISIIGYEYVNVDITLNSKTKYYEEKNGKETEIKASKIKKGDKIKVEGEVVRSDNSPTKTVGKKVVKVIESSSEEGEDEKRTVTFHGTVIQKNSKTMTITMNMWEYLQIEITLDKNTKYYAGESETRDSTIKKGTKVTVEGEIVTKTNSPTKFVAEKVTKISKFPADNNKKNDNIKKADYIGIVASRDNRKILLTIEGFEYVTVEMGINRNTKYYEQINGKETEIKASKIKKGDKVKVEGEVVKSNNLPTTTIAKKVVKVD